MQTLAGPSAVLAEAARTAPGHPWPRVCLDPWLAFTGGWVNDGAVAWRGGHPWGPAAEDLHAVGTAEAAAELLGQLARTGDRLNAAPRSLAAGGWQVGPDRCWWLREISGPIPVQPGQQHVMWLPADAAPRVTRLLDDANPDAAFRPADPGAGRWCGVESGRESGRESGAELVAVACETWPSAHIAQLSSLAVHPTARRRGLGAAVTAFFVGEALAAGAPSVILGVENANHGGRALYDRLGFSAWQLAGVTAG